MRFAAGNDCRCYDEEHLDLCWYCGTSAGLGWSVEIFGDRGETPLLTIVSWIMIVFGEAYFAVSCFDMWNEAD